MQHRNGTRLSSGIARCLLIACSIAAMVYTDLWAHHPNASEGALESRRVAGHHEYVANWTFWPQYTLDNNARVVAAPRIAPPDAPLHLFQRIPSPLTFRGERPTERRLELIGVDQLPRDQITIEMWLCDHVNQPVALLMAARGRASEETPGLSFGYSGQQVLFGIRTSDQPQTSHLEAALPDALAFKEYWWHVVATYDGSAMRLYVNGKPLAQSNAQRGQITYPQDGIFELAAYLAHEPYMELSNLLHAVRIHDHALPAELIHDRFEELCNYVERGVLFPNLFHFNAGPYLNYATQSSMSILWETDRPAEATVRWGETHRLDRTRTIRPPRRIQETVLSDLRPSTPYFYQVTATDEDGSSIDSGVLTFQTAVREDEPFKFGLIGDTETRPHVNNRIAQLLWAERPNFVVHVGDLTDGGTEEHKFQWNMEYFLGLNHLTCRVPVFAVPGNGEGDLYWYNRYHAYPELESVYSFRYGNAEFFMLDSNREEEFAPGTRQFQWLDEHLANSTARWKFICHHHAPYTSEENDYGDAWQGASTRGDEAIRRIVPVYEKHGVDLVMFGHLHLYERSLPIREGKVDFEHGVLYLLAGGAGGNLEDFAPTAAPFSAKTYRGHHYCVVSIAGDTLTMRMYDLTGALRDTHAVSKKPGMHSGQ